MDWILLLLLMNNTQHVRLLDGERSSSSQSWFEDVTWFLSCHDFPTQHTKAITVGKQEMWNVKCFVIWLGGENHVKEHKHACQWQVESVCAVVVCAGLLFPCLHDITAVQEPCSKNYLHHREDRTMVLDLQS